MAEQGASISCLLTVVVIGLSFRCISTSFGVILPICFSHLYPRQLAHLICVPAMCPKQTGHVPERHRKGSSSVGPSHLLGDARRQPSVSRAAQHFLGFQVQRRKNARIRGPSAKGEAMVFWHDNRWQNCTRTKQRKAATVAQFRGSTKHQSLKHQAALSLVPPGRFFSVPIDLLHLGMHVLNGGGR